MNELKAIKQGIEIAIKNGVFVMDDVVSLKVALDRVAVLVEKGLAAEEGGKEDKANLKKK